MNILLCCSAGMSTSLLVEKMKNAAKDMGVEAKIWAVAVGEVQDHMEDADVLLIGPQIRYKLPQLKEKADKYNLPAEVINAVDYGTINGKNVLKRALELINK